MSIVNSGSAFQRRRSSLSSRSSQRPSSRCSSIAQVARPTAQDAFGSPMATPVAPPHQRSPRPPTSAPTRAMPPRSSRSYSASSHNDDKRSCGLSGCSVEDGDISTGGFTLSGVSVEDEQGNTIEMIPPATVDAHLVCIPEDIILLPHHHPVRLIASARRRGELHTVASPPIGNGAINEQIAGDGGPWHQSAQKGVSQPLEKRTRSALPRGAVSTTTTREGRETLSFASPTQMLTATPLNVTANHLISISSSSVALCSEDSPSLNGGDSDGAPPRPFDCVRDDDDATNIARSRHSSFVKTASTLSANSVGGSPIPSPNPSPCSPISLALHDVSSIGIRRVRSSVDSHPKKRNSSISPRQALIPFGAHAPTGAPRFGGHQTSSVHEGLAGFHFPTGVRVTQVTEFSPAAGGMLSMQLYNSSK